MKRKRFKSGRSTRVVDIGGVKIGGGRPVVVQSMTNTHTADVRATLGQIRRLEKAGSEIVRVSVPDKESAEAMKRIVAGSPVPLVADIHFDHRLALAALEAGASGLRINPGNLRRKAHVEAVAKAATARKVPIRIGVNSGSLEKAVLKKHKGRTARALVESALSQARVLEAAGFHDIKISLKSTDVMTTIEAYRLVAKKSDYPLHIGITEAGTRFSGTIRSSVGLGILLAEGIGDTIRVSLAADPVEEVRVAYEILKSLGIRSRGVDVIACPTCSRTQFDVIRVAEELEKKLQNFKGPLTIAVMGCIVNGPGEAAHADLGAVGTRKGVQIFAGGKRIKTVPKGRVVKALMELV